MQIGTVSKNFIKCKEGKNKEFGDFYKNIQKNTKKVKINYQKSTSVLKAQIRNLTLTMREYIVN